MFTFSHIKHGKKCTLPTDNAVTAEHEEDIADNEDSTDSHSRKVFVFVFATLQTAQIMQTIQTSLTKRTFSTKFSL